jgi:hypothetical protein
MKTKGEIRCTILVINLIARWSWVVKFTPEKESVLFCMWRRVIWQIGVSVQICCIKLLPLLPWRCKQRLCFFCVDWYCWLGYTTGWWWWWLYINSLQTLKVSGNLPHLYACKFHLTVQVQIWKIYLINPLTPELNPSAQRCLPKFFTGDFNF